MFEQGRAAFTGETTHDLTNHIGAHRQFSTAHSIGLIPLGDRSRVEIEAGGYGILEERDSVDRYTKYHT